MSIPSSFIDQILDQSDIVDIIGRRVQLNQKGNNFWGICPFHDDTNPSMAVNQDKQFFYCFVCNAKGNAINFLRDFENLDFVDAVESIASAVGLEVPKTHQTVDTTQALTINTRTVKIYEEQLKSSNGKRLLNILNLDQFLEKLLNFLILDTHLMSGKDSFKFYQKSMKKMI